MSTGVDQAVGATSSDRSVQRVHVIKSCDSSLMTFQDLRSGCDYYALWEHQQASPREKDQLINPEAFIAATLVANF